MNTIELIFAFSLQLLIIIIASQVMGYLAKFIGQPKVVGEMIAGVMLGPSLLGFIWPQWQQSVFIEQTQSWLYLGAQLGVGLYMFLVGLEFNTDLFKNQLKSAISVSLAGMLAPFAVAMLLCIWLMDVPGLFTENISFSHASLFMGAAIAITAFPMLARIVYERGLAGTALGTLALAAGAIDDAAAWFILAIVLGSYGGGVLLALKALFGGGLYAYIMLTKATMWLQPLASNAQITGKLSHGTFVFILILFGLSAYAMEWVGLHAVFGGFLLGVAMPRGQLTDILTSRLHTITLVILLPMFFTYSGLKTELTLLASWDLLGITLLILLASILAKGLACWAAARLSGADNPTAMAIGALMNARGLMELIIINIALQHGIIEQGLFSIMVVMAIVTTFMATPIFELVYARKHIKGRE